MDILLKCCSDIQKTKIMVSDHHSMANESESHLVVSNPLRPCGLYCPCNSPGQNTGVGSISLLQGIFPTWGSNPGLPHCRQILYQLSHKRSPNRWQIDGANRWGKSGNSDRFYFLGLQNYWTVTIATKLKDACSLEEKL